MRTFPAQQFSFACCMSRLLVRETLHKRPYRRYVLGGLLLGAATLMAFAALNGQPLTFLPNGTFFANPGGASETYSTTGGGIDLTGPFFQSLGTNGRSCASCHQPSDEI